MWTVAKVQLSLVAVQLGPGQTAALRIQYAGERVGPPGRITPDTWNPANCMQQHKNKAAAAVSFRTSGLQTVCLMDSGGEAAR